jgi:hypothetical protein
MLNRRKAMIGWLIYTAAKPLATRAFNAKAKKAKGVVPGKSSSKGGAARKGAALLAAAGAVAGGLLFWRSRRSESDEGSAEGTGTASTDGGTGSDTGTGAAGSATGEGSKPSEG